MTDDELMGRNEYARHRGCAPNAVKKAEEDGRIAPAVVRNADGSFVGIRWRQADELWSRNTDLEQAARNGKFYAAPGAAGTERREEPQGAGSEPEPEEIEDLDAEVARETRAKFAENKLAIQELDRRRKQLELAEQLGAAVSVEAVAKEIELAHRGMRDQLLAIPDRIATIVAAERDAVRVHVLLTNEIKRVLHDLSDTARRAAGGPD